MFAGKQREGAKRSRTHRVFSSSEIVASSSIMHYCRDACGIGRENRTEPASSFFRMPQNGNPPRHGSSYGWRGQKEGILPIFSPPVASRWRHSLLSHHPRVHAAQSHSMRACYLGRSFLAPGNCSSSQITLKKKSTITLLTKEKEGGKEKEEADVTINCKA